MADLIDSLRVALAGTYSVERELGRGGMGTVFLAEDLKHRRPVAIKVLDPSLAGLLGPERFVREIQTAARLQHPHILPLLDSGAVRGLFFHVMPYVAGDTLRVRLARERQLPQDEAIRLVSAVARALDYAHRQRIVHRDIKPENILLADGEPMIVDFGIAAAIHSSGGPKLTESGLTLGTPPYMSPEQLTARADLDGRSDLYSLGCVLYELLTGQTPFTGPGETLPHQHLNLAPRPVRDLRPATSPELAAIVARALAKLPADRFASGADFAAALAAVPRALTPESMPAAATLDPQAPAAAGASTSAETRALHAPAAAPAARAGRWPPALRWLALAGIIAAAAGLWWRAASRDPATVAGGAQRRWVWLADFDGPAQDPGLAPAARDIVAASFDQSKELATVPAEQVSMALRNSGRPDTSRVDATVARELAYRSSIPVVVHGTLRSIGGAYHVVLQASTAENARVLETATATASSERELVAVLTRLARQLRRALGERPEAFRGAESWADAPTPSFEAFKLYRRARALINQNDDWAALPLLRQAVGLDPEFATAWAYMGTAFSNLGLADSAPMARAEALKHPARLTPTRRLYIEAADAWERGDPAAALAAYEAILELNPSPVDRMAALNNHAGVLSDLGRFEEALARYREAGRVMPIETEPIHGLNISNALVAMNRLREAREAIADQTTGLAVAARMEINIAERSWDAAESLAVGMLSRPGIPSSLRSRFALGRSSARAARGDFAGSRRLLEEAAAGLEQPRSLAVNWLTRDGLARRAGQPLPPIPARLRGTAWGAAAEAVRAVHSGDSSAARRAVASWPEPGGGASRQVLADYVESCLEARRGHWDAVVPRLAPTARRGTRKIPDVEQVLRPMNRWLVADAFESLGQPDSAAAYLELILSPPAYEPPSVPGLGYWEPFVRARLVKLHARNGHRDEARRQWQILSETCTRPDEDARRLLDETLAMLQASEAMRAPEPR